MAQKTVVTLVDDLTGDEAEDITTIEFALDGVAYEIDLADTNSTALRESLAAYVAAARRTGGRRNPGRQPSTRPTTGSGGQVRAAGTATPRATTPGGYDRETSKAIRVWAKEQGFGISERGRVPNNVAEAWEARNQNNDQSSDRSAAFSG